MGDMIKDLMDEFKVGNGDRMKVYGAIGIYQAGVGSGAIKPLSENIPGEYIGPF